MFIGVLLIKYCMYFLFIGKSYVENLFVIIFISKRLFNLFKELCFVYMRVKCMYEVRLFVCFVDFYFIYIFGL